MSILLQLVNHKWQEDCRLEVLPLGKACLIIATVAASPIILLLYIYIYIVLLYSLEASKQLRDLSASHTEETLENVIKVQSRQVGHRCGRQV